MASKSNTPATPAPVKCTMCGKHLKRTSSQGVGMGHTCAQLAAAGITPAQMAAHYAKLTSPTVPPGYVKVAQVHKAIKANPQWGATVSKMVKALGGDRAWGNSPHASIRPVYVGRVRYIHKVYLTKKGQQAIATGNYKGMPKGANLANLQHQVTPGTALSAQQATKPPPATNS